MPDYSQNIFCGRNKFRRPPPPSPPRRQKNFGQCTILGVQKFFLDVQIFSEHQNKPILLDCEANIARLPLFAQQTGDFFAFSLFYFPLFARLMLNICPTFRHSNLFGGAAAPPARTPMTVKFTQNVREVHNIFAISYTELLIIQ